jgi:hypothetical protein
MEIDPAAFVILSEAKNLYPQDHTRGTRFFASLRMTTSKLGRATKHLAYLCTLFIHAPYVLRFTFYVLPFWSLAVVQAFD